MSLHQTNDYDDNKALPKFIILGESQDNNDSTLEKGYIKASNGVYYYFDNEFGLNFEMTGYSTVNISYYAEFLNLIHTKLKTAYEEEIIHKKIPGFSISEEDKELLSDFVSDESKVFFQSLPFIFSEKGEKFYNGIGKIADFFEKLEGFITDGYIKSEDFLQVEKGISLIVSVCFELLNEYISGENLVMDNYGGDFKEAGIDYENLQRQKEKLNHFMTISRDIFQLLEGKYDSNIKMVSDKSVTSKLIFALNSTNAMNIGDFKKTLTLVQNIYPSLYEKLFLLLDEHSLIIENLLQNENQKSNFEVVVNKKASLILGSILGIIGLADVSDLGTRIGNSLSLSNPSIADKLGNFPSLVDGILLDSKKFLKGKV